MKRDLEGGEKSCPPSKRFSPDQECPDQFLSARTSPVVTRSQPARVGTPLHHHWKKQRNTQSLQASSRPWPASDPYFDQAQQGDVPDLPSSNLSQELSSPLLSNGVQHLPVTPCPVSTPHLEASPPPVPEPRTACCYAAWPYVRPKDINEMTSAWRDAQYVASDPQLSLAQIDLHATEEDLVLLYF